MHVLNRSPSERHLLLCAHFPSGHNAFLQIWMYKDENYGNPKEKILKYNFHTKIVFKITFCSKLKFIHNNINFNLKPKTVSSIEKRNANIHTLMRRDIEQPVVLTLTTVRCQ